MRVCNPERRAMSAREGHACPSWFTLSASANATRRVPGPQCSGAKSNTDTIAWILTASPLARG